MSATGSITQKLPIADAPLSLCFAFLSPRQLTEITRVSKQFQNVAKNPGLWALTYHNVHPHYMALSSPRDTFYGRVFNDETRIPQNVITLPERSRFNLSVVGTRLFISQNDKFACISHDATGKNISNAVGPKQKFTNEVSFSNASRRHVAVFDRNRFVILYEHSTGAFKGFVNLPIPRIEPLIGSISLVDDTVVLASQRRIYTQSFNPQQSASDFSVAYRPTLLATYDSHVIAGDLNGFTVYDMTTTQVLARRPSNSGAMKQIIPQVSTSTCLTHDVNGVLSSISVWDMRCNIYSQRSWLDSCIQAVDYQDSTLVTLNAFGYIQFYDMRCEKKGFFFPATHLNSFDVRLQGDTVFSCSSLGFIEKHSFIKPLPEVGSKQAADEPIYSPSPSKKPKR